MKFANFYRDLISEAANSPSFHGDDFEYLLCFVNNKYNVGMKDDKNFKELMDDKKRSKLEKPILEYCKIHGKECADKMKAMGITGEMYNANRANTPITSFWSSFGCKDQTPKTDIYNKDEKYKISVKDATGGQYMSARDNEAKATMMAAIKMCGKKVDTSAAQQIVDLYDTAAMKATSKGVKMGSLGVIQSGSRAGHHYGPEDLIKELFGDKKDGDEIVDLFKNRRKNFNEFKKTFGGLLKKKFTKDKSKQKMMEDLVESCIQNEKLNRKVAEVFNSADNMEFKTNFVKECITGSEKFGSNELGCANYIMIFDDKNVRFNFGKTDMKLFKAKAEHLKISVDFKSAGGNAARALRASGAGKLFPESYDIYGDSLNESLETSFERLENGMLNEGFLDNLGGLVHDVANTIKDKSIQAVNAIKSFVGFVYDFISEAVSNMISKLGSLIHEGWETFLDLMGWEPELQNPEEALDSGNIEPEDASLLQSY